METQNTMRIETVEYLGTTDENTVCECCGKKDLKGTVALSINGMDPVFFGCVCAARTLKRTIKEVKAGTKSADDLKTEVERLARAARASRHDEVWGLYLDKAAGKIRDFGGRQDYFRQIEKLGGYAAAKEGFEKVAG
jgi:hypothetical protein